MYAVTSPRARVSKSAADAAPALVRIYQAWKGSNIFCLQGRLIFGPDVRSLALTVFLIVVPVAIFCVFVGSKLINDFAHHLGVLIIVAVVVFTFYDLILLLLTSGRDPGIVPRNAHPPEPEGYEGSSDVGPGQTPPLRLPRTKDVIVNGVTLKIKYCDTCMLYRPPRCSHCSICNNCVEKFDHHCPWVGQCIGLRNYRFFFMFVSSTTLICLYVHGFCWVYIRRIMDSEHISIWKAMIKTPASIVLIIYTFICVWFVGGLTFFHLYLISTNQSTYENFRYRYDGRVNPYNKGVFGNFMEVFCTSIPQSKNNFRAKVPKDPEIQTRAVGSTFSGSEIEKSARDIEMGRKTVWGETTGRMGEREEQIGYDTGLGKDGGLTDISPELYRNLPTENAEGNLSQNSRRSSWGRRSGSLDISPEVRSFAARVGESRRVIGGSDDNLGADDQRSQRSSQM